MPILTSNGQLLSEAENRLGSLEPVPDAERQDMNALRSRVKRKGYLYFRSFLDREQILQFRRHYFEAMRHTGLVDVEQSLTNDLARSGPVDVQAVRRVLFDEIMSSPEYDAIVAAPAIRNWFAGFYGEQARLLRRRIIRHTIPCETTATHAHYDMMYLREGSELVFSLWIPLGDCPAFRGGLAYLEGSHYWAVEHERRIATGTKQRFFLGADLAQLAERYDSRWLVTDYAAGDVVVHSPFMVHAALDNKDPQGVIRLSTDIRYQPAAARMDWRWDYEASVDDWKLEQLETIEDPAEKARRTKILQEVFAAPAAAGKHPNPSEAAARLDQEREQFLATEYPFKHTWK